MTKDEYRLLGYGILTVVLIAAVVLPFLAFNLMLPRIVMEAIVAAIAVAVFRFSRRARIDERPD